jgi:hypothetical protein
MKAKWTCFIVIDIGIHEKVDMWIDIWKPVV